MKVTFNDGGREKAGYKGITGDCVTRAISIATGKPYQEVYDALNQMSKKERRSKKRKKSNSRTGVRTATIRKYMKEQGWEWTPTMFVGSGCRVHLKEDELPGGTIIVKLSRHICAVVDGVIHDTYDPSRDETRCVYGYWQKGEGNGNQE